MRKLIYTVTFLPIVPVVYLYVVALAWWDLAADLADEWMASQARAAKRGSR